MLSLIDELQAKIGEKFDEMIPTEYKVAWIFFELGPQVAPSFWFCYIDAATDKVIPADCICKRKDIIVRDTDLFNENRDQVISYIRNLQKEYVSELGQQWYGITYKLNQDGTFNISFSYEKPTGSLQQRREKWCMEHLGTMPPTVTADMLRN